MKRLCEQLGNPQKELSFIFIEENDSVNAFAADILKCAGYKVGRYPVAAAFEERERYRIGTRPIAKKAFEELKSQIKEVCDSFAEEGQPQPLEYEKEMAMAFAYFAQKKVQVVLIETKTAFECVRDTFGIGKKMKVSMDAEFIKKVKHSLQGQRFDYKSYKSIEISMAGAEQIENAAYALEAADCLISEGYRISEKAIRKGLKETLIPGCFSVLEKKPYFVVDGADSLKKACDLVESIEHYFSGRRILYIVGMCRTKETEQIIEKTHGYADWIITVCPPGRQLALSSFELAAEIGKLHPNVTAVDSVEEAAEISKLLAAKEDVIIAFGSRSLAGKLLIDKPKLLR